MKSVLSFFVTLVVMTFAPVPSLKAQVNVYHIDGTTVPQTRQGMFYALPRTVVNIEVTVEKLESYKGPYSEYALRYLGIRNVIQSNAVEYGISGIRITTSAEPDPDQYYFVEFGEKLPKSMKGGLLRLSESGIILGTIPVQIDSVERIVTIMEESDETGPAERDVFPEIFKYYADISVFEKVDTIIRKVSIDTMTLERQILKRTMVEKSPEQKAREAADFVSRIKDYRFNLLTGYQEVSYNKETLEYMDSELKMLEREYMKLFTGISIRKTITYHFKYIPLPSQINTDIPLFRFLPARGITELDEAGGRVITANVQRVGNTNIVDSYLGKAEDTDKAHGFYYRIPELARISIKLADGTVSETQCLVSQLGATTFMTPEKWKVDFHENTGSIKSILIE
jgi:hypothetical protein